MAREQEREGDPEASLLERRDVLRTAGALVGFAGLGAVGGAAALQSGTAVDATTVEADHRWQSVELPSTHSDPVVVASGLSYRGPQPATPRLRAVAGTGFEVAVEEWRYLDGNHRRETVGYVATDPGRYDLADGAALEVGRIRTDHRWASPTFDAAFSSRPVVFSQAQTTAGPQPVAPRHRAVGRTGFDVRLQEAEAGGSHRVEDVGYLAVEPGAGTLDGRAFEAGSRDDVGHGWRTIAFDGTYREPVLLAALQTFRGANTCAVRYRNLSGSSVEVKVQEERSADRETAHLGERVGYLVVEGAPSQGTETPTGDTPLSELDRSRVERLVHEYVNERRVEHGLGTLAFDTELREIARYHSEDMAAEDYFSHVSPDGETRADRYEQFGYDCRAPAGDDRYYTGAENILYTYYDSNVRTGEGTVRYTNADELARGIVRGWMNSEGHRENILLSAWDDEGIGVHVTSEGKVYATQNFC
ncbi:MULTISPECIES: CAP domain-containing protein [Halorussus]|uniref:CAP domain-containing protein n=1 Tax=Halorussus TaxID=1070314 RepID=UPI0020A0478C|nr:CAP domain-containing protein [Halorussus vallis]USZ74281.1 CAP domain-containing protein [Halorussus vallis]